MPSDIERSELAPADILGITQVKFERNIPRFARGPVDVTWEVTNRCNLRCKQCFLSNAGPASPDELTTEAGLAMLDNLAEAGVKSLLLSGGDPLLRPDLEELARYAAPRFTVWLQTNGWFLEEKAPMVKRLGFQQVQVSLDGASAEAHDYFRGKGSFDRAVAGIKECVRLRVPSVGIAATISRHNLDQVPMLVDLALELGVRAFETLTFMPSGRGSQIADQVLSPQERMRLYRHLLERQQQLQSRMVVSSEEPHMCIENKGLLEACASPHSHAVGVGCGAGLLGCAIKPNGKVFPCVGVPVEIGDLRTQRLKDIWKTSGVLQKLRNRGEVKGKCGRCEYKFVCSGCRGVAFTATGDVLGEDPSCWHEPNLDQSLISLVTEDWYWTHWTD